MRNIIYIVAALCLLLLVTGCNPMLNRTYTVVSEHVSATGSTASAAALVAESYDELVDCILYCVGEGMEGGRIRLPNCESLEDARREFSRACEEVLTQTPLGAYALYDLDYYCTHVVSYYECSFTCSYSHTIEQISALVRVRNRDDLVEQISKGLSTFQSSIAFEVRDASFTEEQLLEQVREVYYSQPSAALEYPDVSVQAYPEQGSQRIMEIRFGWSAPRETLLSRAEAVALALKDLLGTEPEHTRTGAWQIYKALADRVTPEDGAGNGIYDALILREADSQGNALAFAALCGDCGIPCLSVCGERSEADHWWNIITLDGQNWHVDLTERADESAFLRTDDELKSANYRWPAERYPVCSGS